MQCSTYIVLRYMKLHEATYRSAVSIAGCSEGPRNGNKVFSRSAEGRQDHTRGSSLLPHRDEEDSGDAEHSCVLITFRAVCNA